MQSFLLFFTSWAQGDTLNGDLYYIFQIGPEGYFKSYFNLILRTYGDYKKELDT